MRDLSSQKRIDSTACLPAVNLSRPRRSILCRSPQHGFSLLEVLVTLVIVSFGMLGIASLWGQSLQAGRIAAHSYHAVTLAGDIAARIRANPRAGDAYLLTGEDNNCVGASVNCTAVQMAQNDTLLWDQQAANSLPDGAVTIVLDAGTAPPSYRISVSWTEATTTSNYSIVVSVLAL